MTQVLRFFGESSGSSRITQGAPGALLPAGAKVFLRRRALELGGAMMFAISVVMMISVFGYSPSDPSLNSAGSTAVQNVLGGFGAVSADLLLQALGFACFVPLLTMLIWGMRLVSKVPLKHWVLKFSALMAAATLYAIGLSAMPVTDNWPLMTRMGGFTGTLLLDFLSRSALQFSPHLSHSVVGLICGLLGVLLWVSALGLSLAEWRSVGGSVKGVMSALKSGAKTSQNAIGVAIAWGQTLRSENKSDPQSLAMASIEDDVDEDTITGVAVRVSVGNVDSVADCEDEGSQERSGLVDARAAKPKVGKKAKAKSQGRLNLGDGVYCPPPVELLAAAVSNPTTENLNKEALQQNAKFLASVLDDFGVKGEIVKVRPGPVVTLYELEPAPGTKTSRVIGLSDDIARSMSAVSVRIAVVSGRNVIGIELPNVSREMVYLRELLASKDFEKSKAGLPLALGKDIGGSPVTADLARMPHLLIAGTTGSGKSVAMNTMILSLLYHCSPDECKFIMIDPKMLELSVYEGIPHLLTSVVTEPGKAVVALKWTVREMEDRYKNMSQLGVRNIAGYNTRIKEAKKNGEELTRRVQTGFDDDGKPIFEEQALPMDPLPFIVVVVDEMADLMLVAGKDVEAAIQRLAQMARAAGIHLIMATQRPSVDVITGTVKANFPTRISFQVTSKIDSRTILGQQGAEQLLGQGDMLHMAGGGRISRVHGPFVSDEEVEEVVNHLKAQGMPEYIEDITTDDGADAETPGGGGGKSGDALYDDAVALVAREGKASTSFIQRHLQIGYNRAARIIETMEKEGVVSPANRVGRREVLVGSH
jgi:S-DNA-T family DNA segregation ATPase FtsK/SpoIIIE